MDHEPKSEDQEEYQHWYDVMRTFLLYEDFFSLGIGERQKHLNRLPQEYADMLPDKSFNKLNDLANAAKCNQASGSILLDLLFGDDLVSINAGCIR